MTPTIICTDYETREHYLYQFSDENTSSKNHFLKLIISKRSDSPQVLCECLSAYLSYPEKQTLDSRIKYSKYDTIRTIYSLGFKEQFTQKCLNDEFVSCKHTAFASQDV